MPKAQKKTVKKKSVAKKNPFQRWLAANRRAAWLAVAVVMLAGVGLVYWAQQSSAASMVVASVEAETFTLPSGGQVFQDMTASNGTAVRLTRNGAAINKQVVVATAATQLTISARGAQCNGAPQMVVTVDGKQVLKTAVKATQWADYLATISLAAGTHTLKVSFTNDYNQLGCSRDLFLDKLTVSAPEPTLAPAPAPSPVSVIKPLTPGTSWQWQIDGNTIDETILDNVNNPKKMYDIDMEATPATTIARLKAKGIYAVCYMETGGWESYRSDAAAFPDSVKGNTIGGYPDERWIDIRQIETLKPIMAARMDAAQAKGCEGIEPDLDDSYTERTGFPLTMQNQIDYNKAMIGLAHDRGMSMGHKNGPEVAFATEMSKWADWALNEQCNQYQECDGLKSFVAVNKAVFQVEYSNQNMTTAKFCPADNAANFDGLLKKSSETLGALPRTACRFE